jgi:diacylglycerol kinase
MSDPQLPREPRHVQDVREHVFWRSFHHAFEGISHATRTQSNMRLHLGAAALVLLATLY